MRFAKALRSLLIGVWLGAVLGAGILTAPTIFKKIESRTLAGDLFGEILKRLNSFEITCLIGIVLLRIGFFYWSWKQRVPVKDRNLTRSKMGSNRLLPSDGLLLLILINWFYYAQVITPEMANLKKTITSFDVKVSELAGDPTKKQEIAERIRFETLHHRYSKCMSGNILLGVMMFFIP